MVDGSVDGFPSKGSKPSLSREYQHEIIIMDATMIIHMLLLLLLVNPHEFRLQESVVPHNERSRRCRVLIRLDIGFGGFCAVRWGGVVQVVVVLVVVWWKSG